MENRSDSEKLRALREYVKLHYDGDKKVLGQMFALQDELTSKTGQFVMLVDHESTGPTRRPMQRGPLCGDVLGLERPRETKKTKLSLSVLTSDTLRLDASESVGLNTGKVAAGQFPDGEIEVSKNPLTFSDEHRWIMFGPDGGSREYDDGYMYKRRVVEVLVGERQVISRFSSRFDSPFSDDERLHLAYVVGLARAIDIEMNGNPLLASLRENLRKDIRNRLMFCERLSAAAGNKDRDTAKKATTDMRTAIHLATIIGHSSDPCITDIKRRFLDKT